MTCLIWHPETPGIFSDKKKKKCKMGNYLRQIIRLCTLCFFFVYVCVCVFKMGHTHPSFTCHQISVILTQQYFSYDVNISSGRSDSNNLDRKRAQKQMAYLSVSNICN